MREFSIINVFSNCNNEEVKPIPFEPEIHVNYLYPMVLSEISKSPEGEICMEIDVFVAGDISEILSISFKEGSMEWHNFFRSILPNRLEDWTYEEAVGSGFTGKIVEAGGSIGVEVVQAYLNKKA